MNLGAVLDDAPDGEAVYAGGDRVTREELVARADSLAASLRQAGLQPGDVVAVMLPNSVELVGALFGVWRAGCVYTPLNPPPADDDLLVAVEAVHPGASSRPRPAPNASMARLSE